MTQWRERKRGVTSALFFSLARVGQMGPVVTITCWGGNLDLIVSVCAGLCVRRTHLTQRLGPACIGVCGVPRAAVAPEQSATGGQRWILSVQPSIIELVSLSRIEVAGLCRQSNAEAEQRRIRGGEFRKDNLPGVTATVIWLRCHLSSEIKITFLPFGLILDWRSLILLQLCPLHCDLIKTENLHK